jgi:hypothetical protein
MTTAFLCLVLGLTGCVQLPTMHTSLFGGSVKEDKSKQQKLAPLAPPPPITARFVNQQNAHEISEALWNEIERDLHAPTVTPTGKAP